MLIGRSLWGLLCVGILVLAGCGGETDDGGETAGGSTTTTTSDAGESSESTPAAADQDQVQAENVEVTIASWDEVQAKVAEQKGKVVVLDAWSTSCGPCMKEFPNLVAMHKKYGDKDVVCMSMSTDYAGIASKPPEFYRERVLKFLTQTGATFQNFMLNEDPDAWYAAVNLSAIPAVFVYGRDGELKKRFDGDDTPPGEETFTYEDVNKLVEELVAQ